MCATGLNYGGSAVECYAYGDEGEAEEAGYLNLFCPPQLRTPNNREWQNHQNQIGENIPDCRDDELHKALSTRSFWCGQNLPIVSEGLTFGEGGNDGGEEGYAEEPVGELDEEGVAGFVDVVGYAFEVEDDGEFAHPETRSDVLAEILEVGLYTQSSRDCVRLSIDCQDIAPLEATNPSRI